MPTSTHTRPDGKVVTVKVDAGTVRRETAVERWHRRQGELPVLMDHRTPIWNMARK